MARFRDYIYEAKEKTRSKSLKEETALKLLNTKCKKVLKAYHNETQQFFRSTHIKDDYRWVDPKKSKRASIKGAEGNHYTLLMSNLPSWKNYPKRETAIIGSSTAGGASKMFGLNTYIVFPYDGSKIAIVPSADIWHSMKSVPIKQINIFLREVSKIYNLKDVDKSWNNLKKLIQVIDKDYKDVGPEKLYVKLKGVWGWITRDIWLKEKGNLSFSQFLDWVLEPNRNGFKLSQAGGSMIFPKGSEKEVWTDGKCILVNIEKLDEVWEKLQWA